MTACIVGWGHLPFGKHQSEDYEDLIVKAATMALKDAGISASDIDEVYLGIFNGGFVRQDFPASLVLQVDDALRFKPVTRVENACATGSAAIYQGINAIDAKRARIVLAVGCEKMTHATGKDVNDTLIKASYVKDEAGEIGSFAGVFGHIANLYFQKFGDQSDALARIAAKNHKNGASNPLAHIQKDLGFDFCRNASDGNPVVAGPLKRTDCSLVSDGAAALVLTDVETAMQMKKAVIFRAHEHVNEFLPMKRRDMTFLEGAARAWQQAYAAAKVGVDDLDVVETHDCFTIAELMHYESMGLTPRGQGARAINEGWTEKNGKIPVNPSGGLKAKGHPIGATGISMHVMQAMQLTGEAGGTQVKDPKLAAVFNMGGSGVANYCSILERIR